MGVDPRYFLAALARNKQAVKPRAERFTGPVSAKKARARCETQFQLRWDGPAYTTEHRFHPTRKWRFDYAWPEAKVALEVEGAIFARGKSGHTSGVGVARDAEKGNAAQMIGWVVLRVTDKTNLDDLITGLKALIASRSVAQQ
jgi:hypothetical protein